MLCLGDLVGYGAEPGACVDTVAERAVAVVGGNHEHGAAGLMSLDWFNPAARAAALWTRDQLSTATLEWLGSRPSPRPWTTRPSSTRARGAPRSGTICSRPRTASRSSHRSRPGSASWATSHRPAVWSLGSGGPDHEGRFAAWPVEVPLVDGRRYVINVGSVGQPRDRDPRAAYAIWDPEARRVSIRRVAYDHQAAGRCILAAGLPRVLAERLASGS